MNPQKVRQLREVLHRLGRETRQGEAGLVLEGHYIGISDFDEVER